MVRSPRGVTFFACAKKVTKESTPRSSRPSREAAGVRVAGGNFGTAHPCAGPKRRASCAAPFGFTHRRHRCGWGPTKQKQKPRLRQRQCGQPCPRASTLPLLLLLLSPCFCFGLSAPRSGVASGPGKTRRAAHRDVRRFRQGQDAPSGNSRTDCGPGAKRRARRQGCAFFWLLFFAQAKKSDSRGRRAIVGHRYAPPRQRPDITHKPDSPNQQNNPEHPPTGTPSPSGLKSPP